MHPLKSLYLVAAALTLGGCASQPAVPPPEIAGIEQSAAITVNDLRPKVEGEKEIFSLMITSDAYAIYRVPDDATKPTGPRLLAHRAFEKFPELKDQPKIDVRHFVTYANLQSTLRKNTLIGVFTGPLIGTAIISQQEFPVSEVRTTEIDSQAFENSGGSEEYTRAYFTAEENPSKSPVNVIYMDTDMLGKRIASRCLVPPVAGKPNLFLVEAFDMCIANHLALYGGKNPVPDTAAK